MTTWLAEPGFWVLFVLVVVAAIQATGTVLARPRFHELAELARDLRLDPRANAIDQEWLDEYIALSLDRRSPIVFAATAPIVAITTLPAVIVGVARQEKQGKSIDAMMEAAAAAMIMEATGNDPRRGNLWSDPRRGRVDDLAYQAQALSSPIASLIFGISFIVLLPFAMAPALLVANLPGRFRSIAMRLLHNARWVQHQH